jgi:hypothetical protein
MGYDAFAYWDIRLDDLYGRSIGQLVDVGAFRYAPVVGVLMAPFHALPYWLFLYFWTVVQVVALVLVARRFSLAACAWIGVPVAIYEGNVDLLIALAVVAGIRYPAAWAFPLLTKASSGVGLLWFVARREWRSVAVALAATAVVAAPTILIWPDLWVDWLRVLMDNAAHGAPDELLPLAVRVPIAAAMTIYAARTDRIWLVGLAVALAQPSFGLRSSAVGVSAIGLARLGATPARPTPSAEVVT